MQDLKTISELKNNTEPKEAAAAAPQKQETKPEPEVKPEPEANPDKTEKEITANELTNILKRPVEHKQMASSNDIPESIKKRNNMEEITIFTPTEEGDFADFEDYEQAEPPDPDDFTDESSLIIVFVAIVWPMLMYALDNWLIKSSKPLEYYNLNEQHQKKLQEKLKPVVAKWMNVKGTPEQQLMVAVVTIAGAQLGGAYIAKELNKVNKADDAEIVNDDAE